MAIYNADSSGNLIFAITGLGNPVSTFANEGIATSAIAESPIAGNNPLIYTIGPPNYFVSRGGLVVVSVNLSTQSGLAASAIGEFPISGIVDNIPQVKVTKTNASQELESAGNLVITGQTTEIQVWNKQSAGNLVVSGSTVSLINLLELSAGNLKVSGNTVSQTLFTQNTAGNLIITANDSSLIVLQPTSSGNLVITGQTTEIQVWNKQSAGNLVVSGSTVNEITIEPTSAGNLVVTDFGYGNSLFTGGIAGDPLSSQAIASGNLATPVTIQVSFYGDIESHGNLVIDPVGELVNSLSDSSGIAGAAQADIPIGGGMDTVFTATQYQDLWNQSSAGLLVVSGASAYGYNINSAGELVLSGNTVVNRAQGRTSSGNLIISGNTVVVRTLNFDSSGDLVVTGNTVSEITIEPTSSGNLVISGTTGQSITSAEASAGNLVITGNTVFDSTVLRSSSGNLVIEATNTFADIWAPTSAGNLAITPLGNAVTSAPSTIAGAALAESPIAGSFTYYPQSDFVNILLNEPSAGNLIITGTTTEAYAYVRVTAGNLTVLGNTEFNRAQGRVSSGNLVITGNSSSNRTLTAVSSGNLVITSIGEKVTSAPSTIAGAAIAETPIAGSYTVTVQQTIVNILQLVNSAGNLIITGTDNVQFVSRNVTSSGNLIITGTSQVIFVPGGNDRVSSGNLIVVGSIVESASLKATSAGNLVVTGNTVENSAFNRTSSGNVVIVGATVENTTITIDSAGELVLLGSTVENFAVQRSSAGNVVITGNTVANPAYQRVSAGNLAITGTTESSATWSPNSSGNLIITGTDSVQFISRDITSAGELVVSGTSLVTFVPGGRATPTGGGGSYVFPSSWDILKPYFPDDRHILGYQQGQTDPGNLRVTGFSQVTVVSRAPAPRKTLGDYIRSLEPQRPPSRPAPNIAAPQINFAQQALAEDRLLLSGRLLDFDEIQDELDQELEQGY